MAYNYLEFEKPLADIEARIEQLALSGKDKTAEIDKLRAKANSMRVEIYSNLSPWQKTLVARHQDRPYVEDYVGRIMTDFMEMHGDRAFADDPAIVGGMAWFEGSPVVVVGHSKGRTTREKIRRNFGMPHPEGYRKALRLMKYAERFGKPIITFIDTAGAYPGIGAEERGQSEAIARNLFEMSRIRVPIIAVVTGEGGSGGALALGVGNRVLMFEHAVYSVISPEGCAAILWNDGGKASTAADILKITAGDLLSMGIADEVIPEPPGGAQHDPDTAAQSLAKALHRHMEELSCMGPDELVEDRYGKFRAMGRFVTKE